MKEETKKCPYCGEEILAVAKKCKHCGEWLDENEDSDNEEVLDDNQETAEEEEAEDYSPKSSNLTQRILKRLGGTLIYLVIAFLIFEFGGWKVAWGRSIPRSEQWIVEEARKQREVITTKDQSFLFFKDGIVVRVNKKYYGFVKNKRHFDAPVIQWIMLPLSLTIFGWGIYFLFTGESPEDDD